MELISVVIPTYNRLDSLSACIDSVLNQSLKPDEVILVDDGSTDGSIDFVKEKYKSQVIVIETGGRKGACYARNLGIESSRNDIVAFQDSDDIWLVNKLEDQIELMKKENAEITFSNFIKVNGDLAEVYPTSKEIYFREGNVLDNKRTLNNAIVKNHMSTQTIVFNKSIVKVRFDNQLKRFQDWDFYINCLVNDYKVAFLVKPMVYVEVGCDSITKNYNNGLISRRHIYNKHIKKLGLLAKFRFYREYFIRRVYGVIWRK